MIGAKMNRQNAKKICHDCGGKLVRDWDEYHCRRCGNKISIELARSIASDFNYDRKQA